MPLSAPFSQQTNTFAHFFVIHYGNWQREFVLFTYKPGFILKHAFNTLIFVYFVVISLLLKREAIRCIIHVIFILHGWTHHFISFRRRDQKKHFVGFLLSAHTQIRRCKRFQWRSQRFDSDKGTLLFWHIEHLKTKSPNIVGCKNCEMCGFVAKMLLHRTPLIFKGFPCFMFATSDALFGILGMIFAEG